MSGPLPLNFPSTSPYPIYYEFVTFSTHYLPFSFYLLHLLHLKNLATIKTQPKTFKFYLQTPLFFNSSSWKLLSSSPYSLICNLFSLSPLFFSLIFRLYQCLRRELRCTETLLAHLDQLNMNEEKESSMVSPFRWMNTKSSMKITSDGSYSRQGMHAMLLWIV